MIVDTLNVPRHLDTAKLPVASARNARGQPLAGIRRRLFPKPLKYKVFRAGLGNHTYGAYYSHVTDVGRQRRGTRLCAASWDDIAGGAVRCRYGYFILDGSSLTLENLILEGTID